MGAFTVTDEQIKEWEREKRALEAKLADINEKLNALAVLRRASPSSTPRTKGNGAVIDAMELSL